MPDIRMSSEIQVRSDIQAARALRGKLFETATEVSVMGLSANQTSSGAPLAVSLVFPTLFAAGMSLVDATDGGFWRARRAMRPSWTMEG